MKKYGRILLLVFFVPILMACPGPDPDPDSSEPIIKKGESYISYNDTKFRFLSEKDDFKVGEKFDLKITKEGDYNGVVSIKFADDDVIVAKQFPYTYERTLDKEGSFNVVLRIGEEINGSFVSISQEFDYKMTIYVSK